MRTIYYPTDIEYVLADADELLEKLNAKLLEDMEDTKRTELEIHINKVKERKLEILQAAKNKKYSERESSADGIHEAIDDIVKAMGVMKKYLT